MSHPFLNAETLDVSMTRSGGEPPPRVVTLTIAHHSDPQRVGERARFAALGHPGSRVDIARAEPSFRSADAGSSAGAPLLSPFVSRKPLVLEGLGGGAVRVDARSSGSRVEVDGEAITGTLDLPAEELERGVVLQVGSHVVLILHSENIVDATAGDSTAFSRLVGESEAMQSLRAAIARVAADTRPVLLRGETGTGKELVAAALHEASPRRRQPFVAVNMAAVPQTLAASALFGHARGAFSGADTAHEGHFVRAHGGTLFLDEVGDTPMEVQAALLRVLETGEVLPVGGRTDKAVDVRVVAATDADLDHLISEGRFRAPLFFRLAAHEIRLPSLRARRADIGRLVVHFLMGALDERGRQALLRPGLSEVSPWLTASLVARLCRYEWPGNVRQLRSVCHALALSPGPRAELPAAELDRLLPARAVETASAHAPRPVAALPVSTEVSPSQISPDEVERVMVRFEFRLSAAAEHFGISRPSMNDLVDRHPRLKRAQKLDAAEIRAAESEASRSGRPLWRVLSVSERGLKQRITELGLKSPQSTD